MQSYDDGRTDVPGGLTTPVERVVVVGAGIAGLTVANALTHQGIECIVLEARDRIGGRLHTVELDGIPVDLGGSWIHHPIGNPLTLFADDAALPRRPGDPVPEMSAYDVGQGRRLAADELKPMLAMLFEDFPDAVDRLRGQLGPDATAAAAIDTFVDDEDLDADSARRAHQGLRAVIEADAADKAENQSLRWLWNEIEYEGDLFGDLPTGGYSRVVDAMAEGVEVRLGVEVAEIALSADGVRVQAVDGSTEEGSHVVVTVPLGVLKRGTPRFSPALPSDRVAAIERLGFGQYEKVVVAYDEPFWRGLGLSHLLIFPREPNEPMMVAFDLDAFGDGPVLACHLFHSAAHVLNEGTEGATNRVVGMLDEAMGGSTPSPSAVAVTSWANDPYTCGAYSHVPPGATPDDLDSLGEPVGGRLLFAGEHTQSARTGYADGAMSSGIREAKRLLARPAVHIGPITPQR